MEATIISSLMLKLKVVVNNCILCIYTKEIGNAALTCINCIKKKCKRKKIAYYYAGVQKMSEHATEVRGKF